MLCKSTAQANFSRTIDTSCTFTNFSWPSAVTKVPIRKSFRILYYTDAHCTRSYWDEPRDAGNFPKSPVFDTTLGMGGTGSGTGACVQNGPFKNFTVNIGPGFKTQPRCVNRQITNALSSLTNKAAVDKALAPSTYEEAWITIYNGPHLGGHMSLAMMVGTPKVLYRPIF